MTETTEKVDELTSIITDFSANIETNIKDVDDLVSTKLFYFNSLGSFSQRS